MDAVLSPPAVMPAAPVTTMTAHAIAVAPGAAVAAKPPAMNIHQLMERAQQLQNAAQPAAAAQLYADWIAQGSAPLKHVACFNWGTLLSQLGRDDEAERAYHLALQIDADFPPAHLNLGHLMERRGQREEALAQWQIGRAHV